MKILEQFRIWRIAKRISIIRKVTQKPILDVIKWMCEKRFVYKIEKKIIFEVQKAGGEEKWGIAGRNAFLILYAIVRSIKPCIFIETGVASGTSSYVILQAMERNGKGVLFSIDYPGSWDFNADGKESGWIVPEYLRVRWDLMIGKSSDLLPGLLARQQFMDVFYHDSDHSYDNMILEFNIAWDYIRPGGMLVSHDIDWNSAFHDFCAQKKQKAIIIGNIGIIRKPSANL